ncbi:MAG TPA: aldose 1-epimerase family protein, partial [Candidatus Limnocylindrales bacterium]
ELDGWQILDGYAEDEVAPGGAGQILAPWPNRIRDGEYTFGGQRHALALSEPARHNAAHGLVRWMPWHAEEIAADRISVGCVLAAQPGYPWSLKLTTTWALGPDGLHATHTATNLAAQPCPFGLGLHPYLRLPEATVEDTLLTVPAMTRLTVDDRLIPDGETKVEGTELDFTAPRPIGSSKLDNAFTDIVPGSDGVRLTGGGASAEVTVWASEEFKWWQVFTGDTLTGARHRRSIAVEPMTCPPDAFRSGRDLITLSPGQTWSGSWGIRPVRPV